jgi:hypothetical protein
MLNTTHVFMVDPRLDQSGFDHARQAEDSRRWALEAFEERVSRGSGEERSFGLIEHSSSHPVSASNGQRGDRRSGQDEVHPCPPLLGNEVGEQLSCVPTPAERRRLWRDLTEHIGEERPFAKGTRRG